MRSGDDGRELPSGLVLRPATRDDIDDIVALEVAAFGEADEPGVRAYLDGIDASPANWVVVHDGGRLVSASALLPLRICYDGVRFDAGQIEYVATDPGYQRRGLVRAQFEWHHRRSAALGHAAQFVGGIPYLYRRFGYGYGVSYPDLFVFDRADLSPATDVVVRAAVDADVAGLLALDASRPTQGLRVVRDAVRWHRWIEMASPDGPERLFVAERRSYAEQGVGGTGPGERAAGGPAIVGFSSLTIREDEQRVLFAPAVTADAGVTDALLAHALDQAGDGLVVVGHDTPGTVHGARLRDIGHAVPYGLGLYVRIDDPVAFCDLLRPVLTERLRASAFADRSGEVAISLYATGVTIAYEHGDVVGVRAVAGVEDPFDDFGAGCAPDWFPALVFGRYGAKGLEARCDDVTLGRHAEVLEALFPRRDADLVGDF